MKNSLVKNFVTYGIGNILFTLVNLLFVPIFLEKISINDYGILSVFLVTSNLIMLLFSISISNGILRAYNEGFEREKERKWTTSVILFFVFLCIIFSIFAIIFKEDFSKIVFNDPKLGELFILCSLVGFSRIFIGITSGVLRARNESYQYVMLNLSNVVSLAIINILIIYCTKFTLVSIAWGYVLNGIFSTLLGFILIRKELQFSVDYDGLIYFIKYGLPLGLASLASYFINYGNRYYLINYATQVDVSLMDVAQKISSLVGILLTNAFITAFTPYYLNIFTKISFDDFSKKMNQIVYTFTIFYCFLGLGLILFQDLGLSLLSKKEYLIAAEYVPYLIISNYLNVLFMILTMGTNIEKKTKIELFITITILLVSILLNVLLIKYFGIYGAVWTQLIINFLSVLLIHYYNKKYFPINIQYFSIIKLFIVFFLLIIARRLILDIFEFENIFFKNLVLPSFLLIIFSFIYYKVIFSIKYSFINIFR